MTRRERLMNTLEGRPVDRPAVCFYEINGLDQDPAGPPPFNIYSDPSWKPLLDLAREKTDRIPRRGLYTLFSPRPDCPLEALTQKSATMQGTSEVTRLTIQCKDRVLTAVTRRDPDVDTVWTLEHLVKNTEDLAAYLDLPLPAYEEALNPAPVLEAEKALGDTGIVMIDMGDPLCRAAEVFNMEDYLVIAMTEKALFRRLLDRFAQILSPLVEKTARELPGRLWRVVGSEYASAPYLPPTLYREFLTEYDRPLISAIHRHGGFARIHSHGNLRGILDHMADTGCMGTDPIEPPPQGDVSLLEVREKYGKQWVLLGNLETSDLETLPAPRFIEKIKRALDEGTRGPGRGFVLMPSACPYGRKLSTLSLKNYEAMVSCVENL
jgi:uroporphyrinogen-III decarboxylase